MWCLLPVGFPGLVLTGWYRSPALHRYPMGYPAAALCLGLGLLPHG